MTDKKRILDKIAKCMALAGSSNEHEAAVALRQARRLMEEHSLTDTDVLASQACEANAKAGATTRPSQWEASLASQIGKVFGCTTILSRYRLIAGIARAEWRFIGCGAAPEVAQYVFRVLHRQALKARSDYIKIHLKRCRKNKTRRADLFSEGWVDTALHSITAWELTDDQNQSIEAYISQLGQVKELETRNRNEGRTLSDREFDDFLNGRRTGRDAVVNRGVGADAAPLGLEG